MGAKLLDPAGDLLPGVPLCPPEGDGGTGMTATNSVAVRTGNVSAGTSIFAMVVLEKMMEKVYPEIDMITTPSGKPVAMVHCNNCTSDMNAWVNVFATTAPTIPTHGSVFWAKPQSCWAPSSPPAICTPSCTSRAWKAMPTAAV